jgi:hypothetical protein
MKMTVKEIESQIDSGKTMYIATHLTCKKITPKTLNQWRKSGRPLFKDDTYGTGFYVGRGKSYDYVIERVTKIAFVD